MTLAAWALAAWGASYWALQFAGARPPAATPAVAAAPPVATEPVQVARLFGPAIEVKAPEPVAPVVVDPSRRFALVGVVAGRAADSLALLSLEGKPARPYRVGSRIDNAFTLKSVTTRSAVLTEADTGTTFTVNLAVPGASQSGPTGMPSASAGTPGLPGGGFNPAAAAAAAAAAANPGAASTIPGGPGAAPGIPLPRFGPLPAASMGRRSS